MECHNIVKVGCWLFVAGLLVFCFLPSETEGQETCGPSGCSLSRDGTYMMVAPRKIHPGQVVQVLMAVLANYYDDIDVRVAIQKNRDEEIVAVRRTFTESSGYALLQLDVPQGATPGNYSIRLEGMQKTSVMANPTGFIFENETELIFSTKQLSLFIETNKPMYMQGQTVKFRVMPVKRNLMSWSGSVEAVYVRDGTGTIVRRWDSQQTNAGGVLDLQFGLSDQPAYGTWKIEVLAFGHVYSESFSVDEFYFTAIDVNVSMPLFHSVDEFGIAGTIMANLSLGQPVRGFMKVKAEIMLPPGQQEEGKEYTWPVIERPQRYYPGMSDFMFTMYELEQAWKNGMGGAEGKLENKEVRVEAWTYDWFRREAATGWVSTVIHSRDVEMLLIGDKARTFKPHRAMTVYFAVAHQDGTPLRYFRRQVTVNLHVTAQKGGSRSEEKKLIVPDSGIIQYMWMPGTDDKFATITAYYDVVQSRRVEVTAMRYYSPSDCFIYVTTSTQYPTVDHYMVFTVATNNYVETIYYLIASGGNIVTGSSLAMTSRQKTFSISLSRDMIPEARIVVWHIFKGEVIVDSLNFFVNGTRMNEVELSFNMGKDFTKDTVEITGRTDRSAYIGARVFDYHLWSLGWGNLLSETKIIEELRTFDNHVNHSYHHTWNWKNQEDELVHFPAPTYAIDANLTFSYAGLIIFTDTNVTRLRHNCNETLNFFPCMDGTQCYNKDQWCDGVRQCTDGQDEMGCPKNEVAMFTPERYRVGLVTRHYTLTGEWCWGGHFVMPNGRVDGRLNLPDEPMSWLLTGFSISRDKGFGIVHTPYRMESTRPFYMRAEMPESAVKGEQIGVRLALFNYWGQENLECVVTLHDSDDYRFVVVEEFGIVSSYSPRTIRGAVQTMVYLERGIVTEMQIPVLPVTDGCISVTISADTILYRDTETLTVCTKYDGVTNYLHTPYFIDLINSGTLTLHDLEIPVPERFVEPEQRRHLYVPGSQKATVGIVGDVIGPGFFEEFLTAENTLRKPFGAGEQAMYNFAYNLYNLKYQKQTNQLNQETLEGTLNHLNIALQRQMGYMNSDGSFSMFRDYQVHTPSTWLSAFVLRTLYSAKEGDWESLNFFIPVDLLNKIASWLCTQQTDTGMFQELAPVYDRKQWSSTIEIDGVEYKPNIALTSYVLISLVETKGLTGKAETCSASAKNRALQYLEPLVGHVTNVYELAILAYALEVSGSNKRGDAFIKLDERKRTDNQVYWANKKIPANDVNMVDTLPYYQPRKWYDNEGEGVEATSYALMVYLRQKNHTMASPIMQWLQSMRNTYSGQASTQDTITALIALYEVAKMDTNRALYNIRFNVQATSMGNFSSERNFNSENWPHMQYVDVSPVWGSTRGTVSGTGLALMQLSTEVNVEYPDQILPAAQQHYFDVNISSSYRGANFSVMTQTACARWARSEDISETSGLATMEVHLPSGYVITNDILRAYVQSGDVPTLRRSEFYGRKVVFYFDYLTSDWTCVNWRSDRWFPIANMTIQHSLKVYDYYEPGMHNSTMYTTYDLNGLHICQVCGSFQCPYCPFYNSAITAHLAVTGLTTVLTSLLIYTLLAQCNRWIS